MSHIVVLSTYFLGAASANGICARNIVKELEFQGHEVDVICYENQVDKTNNIHTIKPPFQQYNHEILKLGNKISKFLKLLLGQTKILYSKDLVAQYYDTLSNINKSNNIDTVIAMFFPIEAPQALYLLKKNHPLIVSIIYELDSISDGVGSNGFQYLFNSVYRKWLYRIYSFMDKIFIMKSHEEIWRKVFENRYRVKLRVVDIPVLTPKPSSNPKSRESVISFIYAGLIEKRYRSPHYLLSLLYELNKKMEFDFFFFSKGDCEHEIEIASKSIKGIKQKGYVNQDVLDEAIINTNFLVSIGNSLSRSVPSKLITYLSYGKPIIHFSSQKDDVCIEYLKDYPFALLIDQTVPIEESLNKICDFVRIANNKSISFEIIKRAYYINTPEFSVKSIVSDE